jgi:hypothetical protein
MEIYDIAQHGPGYGYDPGAASAAYLAWILWHLGEQAEARASASRALKIADSKGHAPTLAMVLSWLIFLAVCERDHAGIFDLNERLQRVCDERDCRYWQPFGAACAQWAHYQAGGGQAHLDSMIRSAAEFRELYFTSCLRLLAADACLRENLVERASALVDSALDFIEEHDERLWEAEAFRLLAEIQKRSPTDARPSVDDCLARAVAIARRQGAVALERQVGGSGPASEEILAAANARSRKDNIPPTLH